MPPTRPSSTQIVAPHHSPLVKMLDDLKRASTVPAGDDVTRADLFPENIKQGLVGKARSRFEQPGEADGKDALRVVLVERGGGEAAPLWVELPEVRRGAAPLRK